MSLRTALEALREEIEADLKQGFDTEVHNLVRGYSLSLRMILKMLEDEKFLEIHLKVEDLKNVTP